MGADRAQSTLLGTIVLIGLVVTASVSLLVVGAAGVDQVRSTGEVDSVEQSMARLDAQASLVGLGPSNRTAVVDLPVQRHGQLRTFDTGRIRVTVENETTGAETTIMNRTMGTMAYVNARSESVVAYQGGGVWRRTTAGATMVSPPEFHYRGSTLTMPLLVVDGENSTVGGGRVRIERGRVATVYPDGVAGYSNPLTDGLVNVSVQSRFYRAWGDFFEERTGGDVHYDHANRTVTTRLVTPINADPVASAVTATTPGQLTIIATGGSDFTDSYNSSVGPYAVSQSNRGDIVTRGDVYLQGSATLHGNVSSGGSVDMRGGAYVDGNVAYTVPGGYSCSGCSGYAGWRNDNATVPSVQNVDAVIETVLSEARANNDNGGTPYLTADGRWSADAVKELSAGTYYVNDSLASGDKLILDTSGGNVTLAVEEDVDWTAVDVTVHDSTDDHAAVFVDGDRVAIHGSSVGNQTTKHSPAFRIYGKEGLDMTIDDGTRFAGLVYAPSNDADAGSMIVKHPDTHVYGAVVGGGESMKISAGASIHYDTVLEETTPITRGTATPRVTYVHLTVNELVFDER